MFAPPLAHVHSRSRHGTHESAGFYFDRQNQNIIENRSRARKKSPRDIRCFVLTVFDIDRVEIQRNVERKKVNLKRFGIY